MYHGALLLLLIAACSLPPAKAAISAEKLNNALSNLRDDKKRWNCRDAHAYLMRQKEDPRVIAVLQKQLLVEKDEQAYSAILSVLCSSKAFQHDAAFAARAAKYIEGYARDRRRRSSSRRSRFDDKYGDLFMTINRVNLDCAKFLVRNARKYKDVLEQHIDSREIMLRWITIHALARNSLLHEYSGRFDAQFYNALFRELRDDTQDYNALYASRVLIITHADATPHIRRNLLRPRIDQQERFICQLILNDITKLPNLKLFSLSIGFLDSDAWDWDNDDFRYEYELALFRRLPDPLD